MPEPMIFYAEGSQRRGPYPLSRIGSLNLTPDTLVWYSGLTKWTPASKAPLTAPLFSNFTGNTNNRFSAREMPPKVPTKPDSYLIWGILTTLFCCLPFGVMSIVYAARVDSLYRNGFYNEAYEASDKAKKWAVWSAASSVIIAFLYIILGAAFALPYL